MNTILSRNTTKQRLNWMLALLNEAFLQDNYLLGDRWHAYTFVKSNPEMWGKLENLKRVFAYILTTLFMYPIYMYAT